MRDSDLSAEQATAAEYPADTGHVLVVARPGSGKTHTLVARAQFLLDQGTEPERLLAMTFSRRAAAVLQDRLSGRGIRAGTFHAVCAEILEVHGAAIGVRWPFRIIDEHRAQEILLRAAAEVGTPTPDDRRRRGQFLSELAGRIELRKRLGNTEHQPGELGSLSVDEITRIDDAYCAMLREANALDFADLIAETVRLLAEDVETATLLQQEVSHLLLDEFHDISPEQYRLVTLLAPRRNQTQVFVVGDPDQAIYGWRGSDAPRLFGQFQRDYRPATFSLTTNFRSRAPIVYAADDCLAGDGRTRGSTPARPGTVRPVWCEVGDEVTEARQIAGSIVAAIDSGSVNGYGSFAVLYRSHRIGDAVEAALIHAGVPLWRVEPNRFFEDDDARESLRYLELGIGLVDTGFEPMLNWPRAVVDELTMAKLQFLADKDGMRLMAWLRHGGSRHSEVSPLTRHAVLGLIACVDSSLKPLAELPIAEGVEPFLRLLATRRSPIPRSAHVALRDTLDLLAVKLLPLATALRAALDAGCTIVLGDGGDSDDIGAELIVRYVFDAYFDRGSPGRTDGESGEHQFSIAFGDTPRVEKTGIVLGPLRTRTVDFTVTTVTWRVMQLLLLSFETYERGPFVLLDVETTTDHPERAELLEFAALPFREGEIRGPGASSLVRPSCPHAIDPRATDRHGIRWMDVSSAPQLSDCLPHLLDSLQDQIVVGHNIDSFDVPVLRRAALRAGLAARFPLTIDTLAMAIRLWPGMPSYRLEDLVRTLDPTAMQRHRAQDDCRLTGRLFAELLREARRAREIEVLTECLPVVAASISAATGVVENDNELLLALGGRAVNMRAGSSLMAGWADRVDATTAGRASAAIESSALEAPDEDARWDRLTQGWREAVKAFDAVEPGAAAARFLRHAALAQPVDALPRRGGESDARASLGRDERVHLMTIHSAKGLEWDVVFLAGVEDDQFPHYKAHDEGQMAEERRLLYVGMTRARDRLFLFSTRNRNGRRKQRSRFVDPLIGTSVEVRLPRGEGANSRQRQGAIT